MLDNCNHCQKDQRQLTCPGLDKKTYPNKKVFNDAVQRLNELRDRMQETLDYFKSKAESETECQHYPCRDVYSKGGDEVSCKECEPTGCLNDKCDAWDSDIIDGSYCRYFDIKKLHQCSFYLNDQNEEWIKVKTDKEAELRNNARHLYLAGYTAKEVHSMVKVHSVLSGEETLMATKAQWDRKENISKESANEERCMSGDRTVLEETWLDEEDKRCSHCG